MKIFRSISLLILGLAVIALAAAATTVNGVQGSAAVQVPDVIVLAIQVGLAGLLAIGSKWILLRLGLDLGKYVDPLSITIGSFLVMQLQNIINVINTSYDPLIIMIFKIIAVILGAVGLYSLKPIPKEPV